ANATGSSRRTGERWTTRSVRPTPSTGCTICAYRSVTAAAGDRPTCSSARSAKVKRRTKVMGRFPGETSCLTLVWAVLDLLITHQTNGIRFSQLDYQRLKRARHEGTEQTIPEEVTAA
ncbi:MAG TPA: hypothetical protein VFJ11_05985, partial [Gaiellaceae bacterium]|nr:hypothetical protein [Gaiellaceae bacterium]